MTAGNNFCVRIQLTGPPKQAGKDGNEPESSGKRNYVITGTMYDSTARIDFSKWSTSVQDLQNIEDGACYCLSHPMLERMSQEDQHWSTSPIDRKIKIARKTILTKVEPPPANMPDRCIQPTVQLMDLQQKLDNKGVAGHEHIQIKGEVNKQARFYLADLHGVVVHLQPVKPQKEGYSYDFTLANGAFDMIITAWTSAKAHGFGLNNEVFLEKVKISRPQGAVVASLSLAPKKGSSANEPSKTQGKIHLLTTGTLPTPDANRTSINEPWTKTDYKTLVTDLCCLKNLETIVRQTPPTLEGAEVYILECRGVWITELLEEDKWFQERCPQCRKTEGCDCGVPKKSLCWGNLNIMDGTGTLQVRVGDQEEGAVVSEALCIKNINRLPPIFASDSGSLLLKNRLHLRLRVSAYNSYKGGLKVGARIICAKSDLYLNKHLAGEYAEPLTFKPHTKTINELFYDDLESMGPGKGECEVAICLALSILDASTQMDKDSNLYVMTGRAMVLDSSGVCKEIAITGLDGTEAGAARFSLLKGKAYVLICNEMEPTEGGALSLAIQRGILVKPDEIQVVTDNFSLAARNTRDLLDLQASKKAVPPAAPTTFPELVTFLNKAGLKRKQTEAFGSPAKEASDPLSAFTTHGGASGKKPKAS